MSGGVDSSVVAMLMKKKGYEVTGAFMKNWSHSKYDMGECTWRGERKMAIKIASMLNIPLITLDFEKQYKKHVVEKMFGDYQKGITPNPDIVCNEKIKIPLLLKAAKKLGADYLVTGHYSRIKGGKLYRAKDESKDQSYFLYRLKQNELKKCLFPIGDYTKKQVRDIAKNHKFPNYNKKSTVGICFIGKIDLKKFLQRKIKSKKGRVLDPEGNMVGEHDGIYYYTIGQRLGPRYGFDIKKSGDKKQIKRWYVARKDVRKNIIIAAPQGHRLNYRKNIFIKDFHLISEDKVKFRRYIIKKPVRVFTRIRQVGELLPSKILYDKKKKRFRVVLDKAIAGVSQGQAIVLYKGKEVLGGGVISFT